MIEIGRLCVKTAGRDAGLKCAVVDILDDKYVLIDGETRRRKCNIMHLEPLKEVIKIKKNASHEVIKKEFEEIGLKARETKPKEKKEKPVKSRMKKKATEKTNENKKDKQKKPNKKEKTDKDEKKATKTKSEKTSKTKK